MSMRREEREARVLELIADELPLLLCAGERVVIELLDTDPAEPMFAVSRSIKARFACRRGSADLREAADNGMGT
jgi:hypothetical protein